MTPDQWWELLKAAGPTTAVLIGALYALRYKDTQHSEAQDKRIEDAKAQIKLYLEMRDKEHEQRERMIAALDANADAIRDLRSLVEYVLAERGYNRMPAKPTR